MNDDHDRYRIDSIDDDDRPDETVERPWIVHKTTYDIEAWIDSYNRDLRRVAIKPNATGYGIRFRLEHGGDIYLHTDQEGNILLDVTPEAEWVAPLITAATRVEAPPAQIWSLPGHTLTQLLLGLSPLIVSTRIVTQHDYRPRKW